MKTSFLLVPLAVAILDWIAVGKGWKRIEYAVKPGVMLLLLVWLVSLGGTRGWLAWFTLGIFLSLVGDVLLLFPPKYLVAGLAAFLVAQVCYIVGFNATLPQFHWVILVVAAAVAAIALRMARVLSLSLIAGGKGKLVAPVRAYILVISLMLFSALLTLIRPEWAAGAAVLASLGGISFYTSDSLSAWRRFVGPQPLGRVGEMAIYHLAQFCLVLGAALHFVT